LHKNFNRIRFVVCASKKCFSPIRQAIERLGAEKVSYCSDIETMLKLLGDSIVDVLVCDYALLGKDFLVAAQEIRRKVHGRNPFLILIATADITHSDMLRSLVDVGIDDLLREPVSPDRLAAGIERFSRGRAPFVASYDYVGPTRRVPIRDEADRSSLIEVPNTLLSKILHNASDAELQRIVDAAQLEIEDRQSETRAIQMHELAKAICLAIRLGATESKLGSNIALLLSLARDFVDRTGTRASPQMVSFVKLLIVLVSRINQNGLRSPESDIQLLENLTQAVKRSLTVERDAVALMGDIIEAAAQYGRLH